MGIKHNRQVTQAESLTIQWEIDYVEWNEDHVIDSDVDFGSFKPKTNQIAESTLNAGVTIDGVLCKDGVIPDSAYPNALLLDGSRKMTGNLDIDSNDIDAVSYMEIDWAIRSLYDGYAWLGEPDARFALAYINEGIYFKPNALVGLKWEWDSKYIQIRVNSEMLEWVARLNGGAQSIFTADPNNSLMSTTLNFQPRLPATNIDLGTDAIRWQNIFLKGKVDFDSGDYISYDTTNNRYLFYIGNSVVGYVDNTGFHNGSP